MSEIKKIIEMLSSVCSICVIKRPLDAKEVIMKSTLVIPGSRNDPDQAEQKTLVSAMSCLPYTDLEIQVAALTAEGRTPLEIAEQLLISIPMVHDILSIILAKARGEMRGC
jgi:DNA-binding NarL/FixJ family response regulator